MNTVKVEMDVPKEGKEMVDAIAVVIDHFVMKKPMAEIVAVLPAVIAAVDGFQDLGAEVKSEQKDELAGYLVQKLMAAILK